jgi:hypothetical protein
MLTTYKQQITYLKPPTNQVFNVYIDKTFNIIITTITTTTTMKKLSKYKLNKISKNLDFFFNLATTEDITNGKQWYSVGRNVCVDICSKYDNVDTLKAASVISALSPRNKWEQNIKDAYKVFDAVKNGLNAEDIKVCTFHTNKFKAFAIAKGEVQITDKSLKTYNFVNNLASESNDYLTIDIWHLRACFNNSIKIDKANIGRVAYGQIKDLTITKAKDLGLKGYELQAILWLTVQKHYVY